jgi:hypothetical protein
MRLRAAVVGVIVLLMLASSAARACELCRDSVAASDRAGASASAAPAATASFNSSILWMLGSIAGVGGFAGTAIYRTLRQETEKN